MVNINIWYKCENKPKKKGYYVLLVGMRAKNVGHWDETTILICYWNGRSWTTPEGFKPYKWRYVVKGRDDRHPIIDKRESVLNEVIFS